MSAEGSICSVERDFVEVKLKGEETIVRIPRIAVQRNSAYHPSPKVYDLVYISEDRTWCDYQQPANCKSITTLPQIPGVSEEQRLLFKQEFTEFAEFYNCSSLFCLLYITSYLYRRFEEFRTELIARWESLGVQREDMQFLLSEFSSPQDLLMASTHYTKAKQLYHSVSEVVFRNVQTSHAIDEESRFAIVWNLYIKVKGAEGTKVWKSGLSRSLKIRIYEVDAGRRLVALLPNLDPLGSDGLLLARQWHCEPMDDPSQQPEDQERMKIEMQRNGKLIEATAGFLIGLLDIGSEVKSSLLSSDTASDISNSWSVLNHPVCSQFLSPDQLNQLQALKSKLFCCICLSNVGSITLHGEHLVCKDCMNKHSIENWCRCSSIFLPSEITCPKCRAQSPLDPRDLAQFERFFCIECHSSSSLAKCGQGFHCKAHMTKNLKRGRCSTCPAYYSEESLAQAREITYECVGCGHTFGLQYLSFIPYTPCYCLYCEACLATNPICTRSCAGRIALNPA